MGMPESLDMLKSEEGQLNAVFACFGSAAQHSQLFEEELCQFLDVYNKLRKTNLKLEGSEAAKPKHNKKTIGALLKQMRKGVRFPEQAVDARFDEALEKRNFLIHRFFLERGEKLRTESGRMELLRELVSIEQDLDTVRGWIAGLRIAILETVSGDRRSSDTSPTIFAAEVDIPD